MAAVTRPDNGAFTGTLKTLNVSAALSIVPVDKLSENAPDDGALWEPRDR